MAKRKLLLLGVLLSLAGAAHAAPQTSTAPSGIKAYEEQEFIADFTKFKIGDTAPAQYQTPEYTSTSCVTFPRPMPAHTGPTWVRIMF